MLGDLIEHTDTGSADGMAERLEAARGVHRNLAPDRSAPFFDVPPPLTLLAQAEVLVVEDFCDGKAIVALDQVEVLHRHAGLFIGRLRRLGGGGKASISEARLQVRLTRGYGQADTFDEQRIRPERLGEVGTADDHRRSAVSGWAAIEQSKRAADHRA